MKPDHVQLWTKLRQLLAYEVPAEHRAAFDREITHANWQRSVIFSAVVAIMTLIVGLVPDIYFYKERYWHANPAYGALAALHAFLCLFSLLSFVVLMQVRPTRRPHATVARRRLAMTFVAVTLATAVAFSIAEQRTTGSIAVFLLGISAFASCYYSTKRFCLIMMGGCYLALLIGLFFVQPDRVTLWHHAVVALDVLAIFWVCSRLIYSLKGSNFVQLATIARQAEQLERANAELRAANKLKTSLIEAAAHDLRGPLQTIRGLVKVLREDLDPQSACQPWVQGIADSSQRMLNLVDNLLTEAESDTGELPLNKARTDIGHVVTMVLEAHRPLATAKQITLYFHADPALPPAMVDPVRVAQIFENLLSNAIKYSPSGRCVWIELRPEPGGGQRLSVRDEGPGLTSSDQSRLFTKFQRLSARPTGGETSTGIGLAIVKNLVELHDGRIWVESDGPGRGATFHVLLGLEPPEAAKP